MPARLQHYLSGLRRERGVTIIEMVVVCLILGIVGTASMMLMISVFDSQIRASQYLDQQTTIESYYGFMASRLATTQKGDVGLPYCKPLRGDANTVCEDIAATDKRFNNKCKADAEANGNCKTIVDPLTVSGDQLVFRSGGFCYRIFYINTVDSFPDKPELQLEQIRAAVSTDCNEIAPRRGPSEAPGQGKPADPIIDELYDQSPAALRSFPLANHIIRERPAYASADAPNPLEIFRFYGAGDDTAQVPNGEFAPSTGIATKAQYADAGKQLNQIPLFYRDVSNRGKLAFVKGFAYISPVEHGSRLARVSDRPYSQVFALTQVCDVSGSGGGDGGGLTPGTMFEAQTIRPNSTNESNWVAGGNGPVNIGSGNLESDPLPAEAVPQTVDFQAQVQLRAEDAQVASATATVRASVVLESRVGAGNWTKTEDAFGVSEFSKKALVLRRNFNPFGQQYGYENPTGDAVTLTGAFHLPSSANPQNTQWRLRVLVDRLDGTNVQHLAHRNYTFLTYKVSAGLG